METRISIVVPIYYGEKYITNMIRQIEACKKFCEENMLHVSMEILFVNDAPDVPILLHKESKTVQIVIFNSDDHVGIHGTRVRGLLECKGDYILFLDQDDVIEPRYFWSQLQAIGDSDAVICNATQNSKPRYSDIEFNNIIKELTEGKRNPIVSPGQVLLRKQSIPQVWIENILKHNGADDWFLWICMLSEGFLFSLNNTFLYEHVLHGKNASDDIAAMAQSEYELIAVAKEKNIISSSKLYAMMYSIFQANIYSIQEFCFIKKKLKIMDKWLALQENKIKFSAYLSQLGIHTIAIYGCGLLGDHLYAELREEMTITCFLDRNADQLKREVDVYSLQDDFPKADCIVITIINQAEKVKREIEKKFRGEIIIFSDWIEESGGQI